MKPKVFLSHSHLDKPFIERLANTLKLAGIDCWYDDWEIPPGDSIRQRIFEDGLPNCDVFFVYLTANSIHSKWVQRELDGIFTLEKGGINSELILFIDDEINRGQLSIDLQSKSIPEFNNDNYIRPFAKLVGKVWSVYFSKHVSSTDSKKEPDNSAKDSDSPQDELDVILGQMKSKKVYTSDLMLTQLDLLQYFSGYFLDQSTIVFDKLLEYAPEVFPARVGQIEGRGFTMGGSKFHAGKELKEPLAQLLYDLTQYGVFDEQSNNLEEEFNPDDFNNLTSLNNSHFYSYLARKSIYTLKAKGIHLIRRAGGYSSNFS